MDEIWCFWDVIHIHSLTCHVLNRRLVGEFSASNWLVHFWVLYACGLGKFSHLLKFRDD
mgnify:CR=1 FL=1